MISDDFQASRESFSHILARSCVKQMICSAFASRSAFCFCLLRFEDVYFLLHPVAQLYAVMFALAVEL